MISIFLVVLANLEKQNRRGYILLLEYPRLAPDVAFQKLEWPILGSSGSNFILSIVELGLLVPPTFILLLFTDCASAIGGLLDPQKNPLVHLIVLSHYKVAPRIGF